MGIIGERKKESVGSLGSQCKVTGWSLGGAKSKEHLGILEDLGKMKNKVIWESLRIWRNFEITVTATEW